MRRAHRLRVKQQEEPEINLVPLIDILLVLLIFLMVSTTYNKFSELKIHLPTATVQPKRQNEKEIDVFVSARGIYHVNQAHLAYHGISDLAAALQIARSRLSNPILVINADHNATHQFVINAMEAAQLAGIERIAFATEHR